MIFCEFCNKSFENKKSMTNHRRWHDVPQYKEYHRKYRINSSKSRTGMKMPKLSLSRMGNKNPMWKGDKVGYIALHEYIRFHLPKTDKCEMCKESPPYDAANKSGEYLRELSDWEWLCRKCHMTKDGRLQKLRESSPYKKIDRTKTCNFCKKVYLSKTSKQMFCSYSCSNYSRKK